jgi:hypothetical protein
MGGGIVATYSTMTNGGVTSSNRRMPRCERARAAHVEPRTAAPVPSLPPHPSAAFVALLLLGEGAALAGVGVLRLTTRGDVSGEAGVLSGVFDGMADWRRVVTGIAAFPSRPHAKDRMRENCHTELGGHTCWRGVHTC